MYPSAAIVPDIGIILAYQVVAFVNRPTVRSSPAARYLILMRKEMTFSIASVEVGTGEL
jgi:hypothetical protein